MLSVNIERNKIRKKNTILKLITLLFFIALIIMIYNFKIKYLFKSEGNNYSNNKEEISNINYPDINILKEVSTETKPISFISVGDFLLDRNVGNKMKELNNYYFPIENTKDLLKSADITFCNVECPICEGRTVGPTERSFRADPKTIETLLYGGFDIVSLANNHTMNFGGSCLAKTFEYLQSNEIEYVGAGVNFEDARKPKIISINNINIAILAYNDSDVVPDYYFASDNSVGTNKMDIDNLKEDINFLKEGKYGPVDLIIVSMHSGTEYTEIPNERQTTFARSAIDFGADIILGHHPHHVQHIEQYNSHYIIYSMGNFVLDQMSCADCTKSFAVNLTISKSDIDEVEIIPIRMKNFCETYIVQNKEKEDILSVINFETKEEPYLTYENNTFIIKKRNVLINTEEETTDNKSSNKKIEWIISNNNYNVIKYDNKLYIINNGQIIWSSSNPSEVVDFEIGNIDNDDISELLIIYKNNDSTYNINILELINNEIKLKFEKSYSNYKIENIEITDLDKDNIDEIIFLINNDNSNNNSIEIWQFNNNDLTEEFKISDLNIKDLWINSSNIYMITN